MDFRTTHELSSLSRVMQRELQGKSNSPACLEVGLVCRQTGYEPDVEEVAYSGLGLSPTLS